MRHAGIVVLVCLLAAAPAGGGIDVGKETVLLDGGPGENIQATPRVAFGKGVYLVVWREGWHGKAGRARVFAARVDRGGKVLDLCLSQIDNVPEAKRADRLAEETGHHEAFMGWRLRVYVGHQEMLSHTFVSRKAIALSGRTPYTTLAACRQSHLT